MTVAHAARPDWLTGLTEALADPARLDQAVAVRPGIGARPVSYTHLTLPTTPYV